MEIPHLTKPHNEQLRFKMYERKYVCKYIYTYV